MSSQVLYRKWRPQALSEVVGQEPVTETLRHAVESGKIGHAYLFCGPRGTGKTSTGRILAKAVNCPNQKEGEPCNNCDMCRSITEGRALDVIEIDAASNRGIDEVRSLREKANYAPGLARYKVYIVDEVHMLTEAASNALLKTLEEPPGYVIFILATTEPHKVIATIVSRCQRFNFRRLSQTAVTGKLELICQKEGVRIEAESLRLIARAATGSLRDAENILQQLLAYYGEQIDFDQVRAALGLTGDLRIKQLARNIVDRDISTGLRVINSVNSDGIDLRQFNLELVEYLRELLLASSGCEESLDVTQEDLAEIKSLASGTTLSYLLEAVKLFSSIDFRSDNYSALPLELALVECVLSSDSGWEQPPVAQSSDIEELTNSEESPPPPRGEDGLEVADNNVESPDKEVTQDFDYVRRRWKGFVQSLRGEGSGGTLDALLRSACDPVALEDDTIVLGFYYAFHKEKIDDPKYRYLVERKLGEFFGRPYKIRCILVDHRRQASPLPEEKTSLIEAALEMGAKIKE